MCANRHTIGAFRTCPARTLFPPPNPMGGGAHAREHIDAALLDGGLQLSADDLDHLEVFVDEVLEHHAGDARALVGG